MKHTQLDEAIDEVLKDFDFKDICNRSKVEKLPITNWLPARYKKKFDSLQERSGGKFGKYVKAALAKAIDRVEDQEAALEEHESDKEAC